MEACGQSPYVNNGDSKQVGYRVIYYVRRAHGVIWMLTMYPKNVELPGRRRSGAKAEWLNTLLKMLQSVSRADPPAHRRAGLAHPVVGPGAGGGDLGASVLNL